MILDDLVAVTKARVAQAKQVKPLATLQQQATELANQTPGKDFYRALQKPTLSFICEVKQASPSKGQIASQFDYRQIAKDYTAAGVDAISVLTEPTYFKGDLAYLTAIHQTVATPLLRKDFTIDPYMIYEAKVAGASAILLITAILTDRQLNDYLTLATKLGVAVIVEVHDAAEVKRALAANAQIIGINNRNLKDFSVDFQNTFRLRDQIPSDQLVIAESGIKTATEVAQLQQHHLDAVLIGETMMRAIDKQAMLATLKGDVVND